MRLSKERVRHMAESLVARLVQDGHVTLTGTSKALSESLDQVVTEELSVEESRTYVKRIVLLAESYRSLYSDRG